MLFNVDVYRNAKDEKSVFVFPEDFNTAGKEYKYNTAEDIGKAVAEYIKETYPDIVDYPEDFEFIPEEEM